MAPQVCLLLRSTGLALVRVVSRQAATDVLERQAVETRAVGEGTRKGPGEAWLWGSRRGCRAVSDKALKKGLKAVRPGCRYLLGELYTNIFLPSVATYLLFELRRSKLSSSRHTWT